MDVEAARGVCRVQLGRRFAVEEANRLDEMVGAHGRLTELILDFSDVRQFEDAAVVPLARTLRALSSTRVRLRGLTLHQQRMLRYFGVDLDAVAPPAPTPVPLAAGA